MPNRIEKSVSELINLIRERFRISNELNDLILLLKTTEAEKRIKVFVDFLFNAESVFNSRISAGFIFDEDNIEERNKQAIFSARTNVVLKMIDKILREICFDLIQDLKSSIQDNKIRIDDLISLQIFIERQFFTIPNDTTSMMDFVNPNKRTCFDLTRIIQKVINEILEPGNFKEQYLPDTNLIREIKEILKQVFSGKNHLKRLVLIEKDYKRLESYTITLVEKSQIPGNILKLKPNLSEQYILITYRRILDKLSKNKDRRKLFVKFMYKCFEQFDEKEFSEEEYRNTSVYKGFSKKSDAYMSDLKNFSY